MAPPAGAQGANDRVGQGAEQLNLERVLEMLEAKEGSTGAGTRKVHAAATGAAAGKAAEAVASCGAPGSTALSVKEVLDLVAGLSAAGASAKGTMQQGSGMYLDVGALAQGSERMG